MKINLYFFGKSREISATEKELSKRINFRCPFQIIDLPQAGLRDGAKNKAQEAEKLLKKIANNSCLIVFDEHGENMDSVKFSRNLKEKLVNFGEVNFVIGGAYGLDKKVLDQAHQKISFGSLVWTRNLARQMAVEQIYRALEIDGGSNFHKE